MDLQKRKRLEEELEKYKDKLNQLQKDWASSKEGSRYGNEYLETQVKVYKAMIEEVERELK
ncbi:MAG: hypothetical protein WCV93_01755 [Candidatus Shapirobacteria bacterium]|jgi:hypothetical protein